MEEVAPHRAPFVDGAPSASPAPPGLTEVSPTTGLTSPSTFNPSSCGQLLVFVSQASAHALYSHSCSTGARYCCCNCNFIWMPEVVLDAHCAWSCGWFTCLLPCIDWRWTKFSLNKTLKTEIPHYYQIWANFWQHSAMNSPLDNPNPILNMLFSKLRHLDKIWQHSVINTPLNNPLFYYTCPTNTYQIHTGTHFQDI